MNSLTRSALNFSVFRLIFGLLMIPQVYHLLPHVHDLGRSAFVFHYRGLELIEAYSHGLIDFLGYAAIGGALLLAAGILPRIGALVFMLSFGYLFLIDQSFYNNHYYLWLLISFLFVATDTHKSVSLVDVFRKRYSKEIHVRNYFVFGLLISIVYFYGGVAKLNADWLQGYPMRLMTSARKMPNPDMAGYFLSYAGLVFDLAIPFLLWIRPKSWYVVAPYFLFHLGNYFIFDIGEFPLVMMGAWLIYLPLADRPGLSFWQLSKEVTGRRTAWSVLLSVFFIFQLLFPLRSFLVAGDVAWHRQGYNFSWRMMVNNHEATYFQYLVHIPQLNDSYHVDFSKLLTYRQFYHAYHEPYMIWQLAQKLREDAIVKYKVTEVEVFCKSLIRLNQHPESPLIDSRADLGKADYRPYSKNSFINYTLR